MSRLTLYNLEFSINSSVNVFYKLISNQFQSTELFTNGVVLKEKEAKLWIEQVHELKRSISNKSFS